MLYFNPRHESGATTTTRRETTCMDGGCADIAYVHGWAVVEQCICTGRTVLGQCRSYCRGAVAEEQISAHPCKLDSSIPAADGSALACRIINVLISN